MFLNVRLIRGVSESNYVPICDKDLNYSNSMHLFMLFLPLGVIAGSVFAVLLFGLLIALVVFIFLKRPHIIKWVKSH